MNALRRIHAALVTGGLLIDAQPVSARPAVDLGDARVGSLDMRDWRERIKAVDQRVDQTIDAGLWERVGEHRYVVADTFSHGRELADTVTHWQGTRVPRRLGRLLSAAPGEAYVRQQVRMRVLRAI